MRELAVTGSRLKSGCLGLLAIGVVFLWSGDASIAMPKDETGVDQALKAAFDKARLRIMDDYCKDLEKEARWAFKRTSQAARTLW